MVLGGLSGCQSLGVPIAQWRSSYDSGLAKKLSKDEIASSSSEKLADSHSLLERWLRPLGMRGVSSGSEDDEAKRNPSTLVLGSNGWKPFSKPESNPEAQKELDDAIALFQQGKLPEAETAFARIAKKRKESPWGEKAAVLPRRNPIPA